MPSNASPTNKSSGGLPSATGGRKFAEIAARRPSPGPADYTLPSTLGSNQDKTMLQPPSYSIGYRPGSCLVENWRKPGPLYFVDGNQSARGFRSAPNYSMRARPKDLTAFNGPSAMAYAPERCPKSTEMQSPSFSIGNKLKPLPSDSVHKPSPFAYRLPDTLGSAGKIYSGRTSPSPSMGGSLTKGSFLDVPWAKNPTVGDYNISDATNRTLHSPPRYTMPSKAVPPSPGTKTPGPINTVASLQKLNKTAPAYSLGVKHSPYTLDNIPIRPGKLGNTTNASQMGQLGMTR